MTFVAFVVVVDCDSCNFVTSYAVLYCVHIQEFIAIYCSTFKYVES